MSLFGQEDPYSMGGSRPPNDPGYGATEPPKKGLLSGYTKPKPANPAISDKDQARIDAMADRENNKRKPGNVLQESQFFAPTIDPNAFKLPGQAGLNAALLQRQGMVDQRVAPTMQAAQLGPMAQAAGGDLGFYNQSQQGQSQLAQQLMAQATGQGGPSLAEQQLQRGLQGNIASQMALAGSMPGGGNPALAQRTLQNQIAGAQLDTSGQAAMLRAQEQQQAQGQLAQLLGQQGQLGLGAAGLQQQGAQFNVGQTNTGALQQGLFQQQAGQANLGAALQSQGLQDAMTRELLAQRLGISRTQLEAAMQQQQMQSANQLAAQQLEATIQAAKYGVPSIWGQIGAGAAQGVAAAGTKVLLS